MQPTRNMKDLRRRAQLATLEWLGMIDRAFMFEIQQRGLDEIVRLTGSRLGYLYTFDGATDTIAILNVSTADQQQQSLVRDREEILSRKGYWSDCLAAQQAVIRNRAVAALPPRVEKLGPITRDLTSPIFNENKIVAVIGVANRATAYDQLDADLLQEMATGLWRVVIRKRLHDSMSDDVK